MDAVVSKDDQQTAPQRMSRRDRVTGGAPRVSVRWAAVGLFFAAILASGTWTFRALLFDNNLHVVVPGKVYRSALPSVEDLPELARRLGLRSILNLRGGKEDWEWFRQERAAAEQCGLELYTLHLNPVRLPGAQQLRALVDILDTCPKPVLIHCRRGIDRTGLASALYELLEARAPETALDQFRLPYGYVTALSQSDLPEVLHLYTAWLEGRSQRHTPNRLRQWVNSHYVPYFYRAEIEAIQWPAEVFAGIAATARFRVTNRSPGDWRLQSLPHQGIHLGVKVKSLDATTPYEEQVRGTLLDRVVGPGDSVVIDATLPVIMTPGFYRVTVDMVDESVVWFEDMGSPTLEMDLDVSSGRLASGDRVNAVRRRSATLSEGRQLPRR